MNELYHKMVPCPWCNSTNVNVILSSDMAVQCLGCGAKIPTWKKTIKEALNKWNHRFSQLLNASAERDQKNEKFEPSETFQHLFNPDGSLKDGRKGHINACDVFVPEGDKK